MHTPWMYTATALFPRFFSINLYFFLPAPTYFRFFLFFDYLLPPPFDFTYVP